MRPSARDRLERLTLYTGMVVAALYSIWPIFIMALEGADTDLSPLFSGRGLRFVGGVPFYSGGIFPTLIHYLDALTAGGFLRLGANSLIVAAVSIAIALACGIPVGYILARVEIKGRGVVSYILLALRTVSPFAVVLPLYITFSRIGLWDTYLGVPLAEEMLILSVVVWLLRGFFADIPPQIYDAADLFGQGEAQIFRRVALPMVLPGIVITSVFAFILIWNEFLIADIMTGGVTKTVAVGIWTGLENVAPFKVVNWDDLNAAGFLALAPALVVMLAIRKYLAKGFSLGLAR